MFTISCKKPYNPPAITAVINYLVVEGVINAGPDSTIFKLSRTYNLADNKSPHPESNASVSVESDASGSYPLTEIKSGYYSAASLNLDNTGKYRLRIKTSDNQEYLSDFVEVKITPPIDSIGFTVQGEGLQIYANTHDPNNNTRYYRWEYVETWRFHSKYLSAFVSDGSDIVLRRPDQMIYYCFANNASSTIVLGSSAKLKQDVIYQNPITSIPSVSEKIELKYSILLKQYGLTAGAFKFWSDLKRNTEQLGSIFDAQPSQINGNIHNISNLSEPVVGYISAVTVQTKRIFISRGQLPSTWLAAYPYDCLEDSAWKVKPTPHSTDLLSVIPLPNDEIPIMEFFIPFDPFPAGFIISGTTCVDCTIRGKTKQPDFWK